MELDSALQHWGLDVGQVRQHVYAAPRPRERERWHALWLLGQGWTQTQIAQALDRDAHTIGTWLEAFRQRGPAGFEDEPHGGAPPPSRRTRLLR